MHVGELDAGEDRLPQVLGPDRHVVGVVLVGELDRAVVAVLQHDGLAAVGSVEPGHELGMVADSYRIVGNVWTAGRADRAAAAASGAAAAAGAAARTSAARRARSSAGAAARFHNVRTHHELTANSPPMTKIKRFLVSRSYTKLLNTNAANIPPGKTLPAIDARLVLMLNASVK